MIEAARELLSKGRQFVALAAAAFVFFGAVIAVFTLTMREQQDMADRVKEDALWASYQLNREAMKLGQAVEEYRHEPSQKGLDSVALRMDILYSRLQVLNSAQFPNVFDNARDFAEHVRAAAAGIETVDAQIQAILSRTDFSVADLLAVSGDLDALIAESEEMLLHAKELASVDQAETRNYISQLYSVLATLVGAGTLVMIAIVISLARKVAEASRSRRRLEDLAVELRASADRARAASQAKSAFLATMSHEIRTPMNGVIGTVDVMLDMDMTPEMRSLATIIRSCGMSLLELINDILDFSKLEAGGVELEHIAFDPCALAEEASRIVERRATDKGLLLVVAPYFGADTRCTGDPARLKQVVVNLVSNAVKFTEKGHVSVRCRILPETGRLRVEVADTGIGIPREKIDQLFQEFTQVDASVTRKYGGTGLGLAICRRLIEQMGGKIGVSSEPGRGSTFWFEVPGGVHRAEGPAQPSGRTVSLAVSDPDVRDDLVGIVRYWGGRIEPIGASEILVNTVTENGATTLRVTDCTGEEKRLGFVSPGSCVGGRPEEAAEPPVDRRRLAILAAEDNRVNQEILRRLLVAMGHDVSMVDDGAQAVEAAGAGGFDLVLMDMMMPVMDGLEATRRIRALPAPASRVPILGVTANAFKSDREACLAAGMDGFLTKPVGKAALVKAIAEVVGETDTDAGAGAAGAPARPAPGLREDRLADLEKELGTDGVAFIYGCYVDETKGLLDELAGAIAGGDAAIRKRALHTIKGSSANVGFSEIEETALGLMGMDEIDEATLAAFDALVRAAIDEAAAVKARHETAGAAVPAVPAMVH